jgi:hypothetical protein
MHTVKKHQQDFAIGLAGSVTLKTIEALKVQYIISN